MIGIRGCFRTKETRLTPRSLAYGCMLPSCILKVPYLTVQQASIELSNSLFTRAELYGDGPS